MESGRSLFVGVTLLTVMLVAVSGVVVPMIDPNYPVYYVLEPRALNMTCTMQNTDRLEWYKGSSKATEGQGITSSNIIHYPNGVLTMTVTIGKTTTSVADSGTFKCQANSTQYRVIDVKVLSVFVTNADYNKTMGSATLGCNLSLDPSKYNMHWEFKNEKLVDNNKYTIYGGNNTLVISDPDTTNEGEYSCVFSFTDNKQIIRVPASLEITANTNINLAGRKNVVWLLYILSTLVSVLLLFN